MNVESDRSWGDDIGVLSPGGSFPAPSDLAQALDFCADAMAGSDELLVLVNDPQRHTDSAAVLAVAEGLRKRGWFPSRWRVLVACGTHHFESSVRSSFEHWLASAGDAIAEIAWHDCDDPSLCPVTRDADWLAHPWLAAGDGPVLAIGSVEPHYFAGLTGAHKTVTIGCAAAGAVEANHAGAMSPDAAPLALAGNPVFDGVAAMLADVQARRPVTAVNLVQVGADILAAAAGDPLRTLDQLRGPVERIFVRTLDEPADALILDTTGPLGVSFYQADKAIKNSEDAVVDGGLLVLVAPCGDGIGQDHFVSLLAEAATYRQAVEMVDARGYRLGDHKAVRLRRLTDPAERGVRIVVVSDGLDRRACEVLGMTKAASVADALDDAGIRPGPHRVFAVRNAANTVVRAIRHPAVSGIDDAGVCR